MANQIHPDASLIPLLLRVVSPSVVYRLFVNDIDIDADTVIGDFEEPAGNAAYDPAVVDLAAFSLNSVAAHKGTVKAAPVALAMDQQDDVTVYGYFVVDLDYSMLFAALKFDVPVSLDASGASIPIVPIFGDESRYV